MTTRDEIIALAEHNGIYYRATPLGTSEMFCFDSSLEAFYHAAQRQAYGRAVAAVYSVDEDSLGWVSKPDAMSAIRALIEGDEK